MNKNVIWLKQMIAAISLSVAMTVSGTASADLVRNGDFNNPGIVPNNYFPNANVSDWTYTNTGQGGVAYIYGPGGADGIGAGPGLKVYLWGPRNPVPNSNNGLPLTSPNGNNYLASDGDPVFSRLISQPIAITANTKYVLSFDYAEAQLRNFDGTLWGDGRDTQGAWQVSLGGTITGSGTLAGGTVLTGPGSSTLNGNTTTTPVLTIPDHGFSGWQHASFKFTATAAESATGLLSFLAIGAPGGLPPVALLDSVSINPVPEPSSVLLLSLGLMGLVGIWVHRRRSSAKATLLGRLGPGLTGQSPISPPAG